MWRTCIIHLCIVRPSQRHFCEHSPLQDAQKDDWGRRHIEYQVHGRLGMSAPLQRLINTTYTASELQGCLLKRAAQPNFHDQNRMMLPMVGYTTRWRTRADLVNLPSTVTFIG